MTEPKYTLAQARRKMLQVECEAGGHAPSWADRTMADPVGRHVCDCGHIEWLPRIRTVTTQQKV